MTTDPLRSEMMSRIGGKNTRPEIRLRKALWARGLRYRLHTRTPVGRPDLVFLGLRIAVFVDGCFWHGCPEHYVRPRSREQFWARKLRTNVERDRRQTLRLEELGWTVCRVWEHEIEADLAETVARIETVVAEPSREHARSTWRVVEVQQINEAEGLERRMMERLRDPDQTCIIERKRSTRKWSSPS